MWPLEIRRRLRESISKTAINMFLFKKKRRSGRGKIADKPAGKTAGVIGGLQKETRHGIAAVVLFLLAILFALSLFDAAGPAGRAVYSWLEMLLGVGYVLVPLALIFGGMVLLRAVVPHIVARTSVTGVVFVLAGLGFIDIIFRARTDQAFHGGLLGSLIASPFIRLFEPLLAAIILAALILIALLVMFDTKLTTEGTILGLRLWGRNTQDDEDAAVLEASEEAVEEGESLDDEDEPGYESELPLDPSTPDDDDLNVIGMHGEGITPVKAKKRRGRYIPPPLSLLSEDSDKPEVGDIKANANIVKRTLANFGIDVEMDEVAIGPSVTRYALKPAEGVKLSRIVGLQNELSLALAAHPLRIEAPIPGKSLVGIEIPNRTKATVRLRTLLSTKEFQGSINPLTIALGRGSSGKSHYTNLAKAPHMLIAGATGSGKSVTIHTVIASLLYRNGPEDLRFIMIDPKRVELTLYNKIPHLLTPVITDPKKAILALKWAAKEMSRRYDILETEAVRDIQSYHKNIFESGKSANDASSPERMPYIVIVLDELADMMSSYPREFEASIVRLAQMSRAVGIHLILSTQRPSVEVITGLIKANVPTRIALQVPSQVDSRTILDMPGAEKLLGAGDMLYLGGEMSKPIRVQSAFVTEGELKSIAKHLVLHNEDEDGDMLGMSDLEGEPSSERPDAIFSSGMDDPDDEDELFEEAREMVVYSGKASSSYLQRKLKIGYARAARLLDLLEEKGVVGPGSGSKPREVYYSSPRMSQGGDTVADE